MPNIAFAGFRHSHIIGLYNACKESPRVNISGAFEAHEETRLDIEKTLGVDFNFKSYEELLSDKGTDAVAIGDYYGARGKLAIEALKHGKHVIADKPLCTSQKEERQIRKLAEKTGLKVYLMLDLRFYDSVNTAKKVLDEGKLGDINNIIFEGQHPLMYGSRPGWYFERGKHGGTINDIAIHGVDIVRYLTGLEVKTVNAARSWNAFAANEPDFCDSAMFMCELSNGAGLMADVSYAVPNSQGFTLPTYWHFQFWGRKGMMSFGINRETVDLYLDGETEARKITPEPFGKTLLDDFLDNLDGKENLILTSEDVLASTATTLKIQKAAK